MTLHSNTRGSRRQRRGALVAGITAAVLVGITACSSAGSSSSSSGGVPTTLWVASQSESTDTRTAPNLKDWNKANPSSQITASYFPPTAYETKIRTAVGSGAAPNIIFSWGGGPLQAYVKAHKVVDLTKAVASTKGKYIPSTLGQGTVNGKLYAIPMNPIQPIMFYYNKDVLKKAGISAPKTWDEILASIPKLKAIGVAPFSLAGASKWPELMWEEYLVDRVAGPSAFNDILAGKADSWSNPGVIKANTMIQQLVRAGGFVDGFSSVVADANADVALLYTGKAAMLLQGTWIYPTVMQQDADFAKSGLGFTTFPAVEGGKGDPANLVGNPTNYFSVSSSATPAEQKAAINYLNTGLWKPADIKRMIAVQGVPPLVGIGKQIAASPNSALAQKTYALTEAAPNFAPSWDQALPPAQATAMLNNLSQLFGLQITPKQFSTTMDQTIGQ